MGYGVSRMITSIRKEYVSNLLEYLMDIENSEMPGVAFDIPEEWLCHDDCKYCEYNLGGVDCDKKWPKMDTHLRQMKQPVGFETKKEVE